MVSPISINMDMNKPIKNLGRWAEDQFAAFCSEAGVAANRSQVDETGWDFLLELPAPRAKFAPPDLQRIETTARAQVKSRLKGALSTDFKLSNARRFAALPEPCFVILAVNRRPNGTPDRRRTGTPFAIVRSVDGGRGFRSAGGVGRA